jgi:hypothetical protein
MSVQPSAATTLAISKADTALTAKEEAALTLHIPSMESRRAGALRHWDSRASGYKIPDRIGARVNIWTEKADDGYMKNICYVDPSEEPEKSEFAAAYKQAKEDYEEGSEVPTFTKLWASLGVATSE